MAACVVLLIEDNPSDVKITRRALTTAGVDVRLEVARDGSAAIDYLFGAVAKPLPDIVLLDVNLPRINGGEVLERIRGDDRTRNLPVVLLTSSIEQEDFARSADPSVSAFVCKPFRFEEFALAAGDLGVRWLEKH